MIEPGSDVTKSPHASARAVWASRRFETPTKCSDQGSSRALCGRRCWTGRHPEKSASARVVESSRYCAKFSWSVDYTEQAGPVDLDDSSSRCQAETFSDFAESCFVHGSSAKTILAYNDSILRCIF